VSLLTRRLMSALALVVTLCPTAWAQEIEFEVASIRPSPDGPPAPGAAGVHISQQQVRFSYLSLRDYIGIAYRVPVQLISAPEWINAARFDVSATFPAGATAEHFPQLVQSLLRDRFHLQAHRESREFPIYVLEVAAAGLKIAAVPEEELKEGPFSVTSSGDANGIAADLGQGSSLVVNSARFEARKVTMATLVETLGRFVDRTIVDQTKLEGRYTVAFALRPEDYGPMMVRAAVNAGIPMPPQALAQLDGASAGSVFEGLKSLGLSLEARRGPLNVLVVDNIDRTPTEI
jgi:uncharacterized protein (TIGR03435 family)